jgi:hypothetical protein
MSRILKRPMFRIGGSTNEGIMHGLVDRKGYATGTSKEEILADLRTDAPRDTSMYEMLIGGGLNLVSGAGAGEGLMANVARSYKGPSETFFERQRAAKDYDRKLEQTAGQMAIQHRLNLAEIAAKNNPQSALYNVYLEQGVEQGMSGPEAQRYATYHTTLKEDLRKKVGGNRVGGIIEFDLNDEKQKRKQLPKMKKDIGKYFYDPYDGKIKQLVEQNGVLGFLEFDSVDSINFAAVPGTSTETSTPYQDAQDFRDQEKSEGILTEEDIRDYKLV